jgi:hypothetical protein
MEEQTKQTIKGFHLYIPELLLEEYRKLAQEDNRSVNAEIIWVLQQYVKKQKGK